MKSQTIIELILGSIRVDVDLRSIHWSNIELKPKFILFRNVVAHFKHTYLHPRKDAHYPQVHNSQSPLCFHF